MKETKTPYQILSTKEEKKEIKKLLHDNKPYGWTNMEFLISLLKNVEEFYNVDEEEIRKKDEVVESKPTDSQMKTFDRRDTVGY